MIKAAINLLPWRAAQRSYLLKNFMIMLVSVGLIVTSGVYLSYRLNNDFIQKKNILNQQIKQNSMLISHYRKRIYLLKKQRSIPGSKKLVYYNILQLLSQLSHLPVESGYLTKLEVKNHFVTLKGFTHKQNELDHITAFLKKQTNIEQLQLQRIEHTNNQIAFALNFVLKAGASS